MTCTTGYIGHGVPYPIYSNLRESPISRLVFAPSSGVENSCLAFCGTFSPAETVCLGVFGRGFQPRNTGDRDFQSLAQALLPRLWPTLSTKSLSAYEDTAGRVPTKISLIIAVVEYYATSQQHSYSSSVFAIACPAAKPDRYAPSTRPRPPKASPAKNTGWPSS